MDIGITLGYVMKQSNAKTSIDFQTAVGLCRDAGFEYIDYTGDFRREDWEVEALRQREILDSAGVTVEQTHLPFNRYCSYTDDEFAVYTRRALELSRIFGARYVVVHADEYRTAGRYDVDEILAFTREYLSPSVDFCERNGMTLAVENVFEDGSRRWQQVDGKSRFTSRIEELIAVADMFDTPNVRCCWDFGHGRCQYGDDAPKALAALGDRVVCTHTHDNYYEKDLHLIPFFGASDWQENMRVLRECGYHGKLTLELVYGALPKALLPDMLRTAYHSAQILTEMFDN